MPLDPHEYIGQVVLTEHGPALTPGAVLRLLDELSDEEAAALLAYAAGEDDDFPLRATAWLIQHFNLELRPRQ
jgi:hypothetical protein